MMNFLFDEDKIKTQNQKFYFFFYRSSLNKKYFLNRNLQTKIIKNKTIF